MVDQNIWTQKYAPVSVEDIILHPVVRQQLKNVLRNPQNIILYGSPGVGKGTFTKIFLNKTGCDKMWKNASHDTGVDMIRNHISPFSTAASPRTFFDIPASHNQELKEQYKNLKVVIFNEAENLSEEAQNALRELIENVEKRCKFIFMTNRIEKIDKAIQSRCMLIEIKDPPVADVQRFMENILREEGISYDVSNLSYYVQNNYPDIRKTINVIKGNSNNSRLEEPQFSANINTIDKLLIDLRMYMAFYGIKRNEVYNLIKDELSEPIQIKIFYMLLDPKQINKVGKRKKEAVVNCVSDMYPLKSWLHDYIKLDK
jgi:DNA polymerase III delta prime subunit